MSFASPTDAAEMPFNFSPQPRALSIYSAVPVDAKGRLLVRYTSSERAHEREGELMAR